MKKIVASNLRLIGVVLHDGQSEEDALKVLLNIINTEMGSRGYDIKVAKTEDTDTYSWEPDERIVEKTD